MNYNESVMTVKQLANELGVSYDTANNAVKRLFPELIKNGVKTLLTEKHIACISKELKNNNAVMDRVTFEVSSKVKNTETELEVIGNALASFERLKNLYIQKENEYKEIIAQKDKIIEEQKPKVEVYDGISDTSTLQDLQTVAQTIGLKNVFKVLVADGIIEPKILNDGQTYYKPYAKYSQYFTLKDGKVWKDDNGVTHIRPRIFVTGKGLIWMTKKYGKAE